MERVVTNGRGQLHRARIVALLQGQYAYTTRLSLDNGLTRTCTVNAQKKFFNTAIVLNVQRR